MTGRRVAFLLGSFQIGGIERMCLNLSAGLSSRGYEVDIVALDAEGPLLENVAEGVRVVELSDSESWLPGAFSNVGPLAEYLDQREPTVCLSENSHLNLVNVLACGRSDTGTSSIVRENGLTPEATRLSGRHWKERATQLLAALLYRRADRVVGVSQGVADSLVKTIRLRPDDIQVVYNPIITDDIYEQAAVPADHVWFGSDSTAVVLGVGRLQPSKDFTTLIRSFARVTADWPETRLVILGDGPRRDSLEQTASELGVADRLWLPGTVSNPYKYMNEASVFALSSVSEGLPTVLVEAMACGCPVVATDCPYGPTEVLDGGRYGSLVAPSNPLALADAIGEMLSAHGQPDGIAGHLEQFTLDAILDEYELLIGNVC